MIQVFKAALTEIHLTSQKLIIPSESDLFQNNTNLCSAEGLNSK